MLSENIRPYKIGKSKLTSRQSWVSIARHPREVPNTPNTRRETTKLLSGLTIALDIKDPRLYLQDWSYSFSMLNRSKNTLTYISWIVRPPATFHNRIIADLKADLRYGRRVQTFPKRPQRAFSLLSSKISAIQQLHVPLQWSPTISNPL